MTPAQIRDWSRVLNTQARRERFTERAGIREYDGGSRRESAEILAFWDVATEIHNLNHAQQAVSLE